jgi:hypothetical protein
MIIVWEWLNPQTILHFEHKNSILENKVLILRIKIDYMLSTVYDCLIEIERFKV